MLAVGDFMSSVIDEGGYGRFGAYSRVELERFFHLDDEDRRLIEARRRDHNRLGFALQVVTVRHLGMFLPDPLEVPPELVGSLAEQLGIEDPTCVKRYTDREKTKLEHAWEIQREYGLTPFAEVEPELMAWIADQAWMTEINAGINDDPGAGRRRSPMAFLQFGQGRRGRRAGFWR